MKQKRTLVTAALPYANGNLHVGHIAGAYLPADIYVRYLRSRQQEVLFVCGSDDHGVPILLSARKEQKTPEEVVRLAHDAQTRDFEGLGIHFDVYGSTSSADHHQFSRQFFSLVDKNGYLEKRSTEQFYDETANMFLPDRYVQGTCPHCHSENALGDQCENCGKSLESTSLIEPRSVISGAQPVLRTTEHHYFRLSSFTKPLQLWHAQHPEWRPNVKKFCRGLLEQGLPDRAVTRDLDWGVRLPDGPPGKVLYVWFDAPLGYITFTGQWCRDRGGSFDEFSHWWQSEESRIVHFIGEDNVIFHALMFPAMMMAAGGYRLPQNVVANSYLNLMTDSGEVTKLSKSRGTAIWIEDYLRHSAPDSLRYYLTLLGLENQRAVFRYRDFHARHNNELAAALGNFVYRTMTFCAKYFDSQVPQRRGEEAIDIEFANACRQLPNEVSDRIDRFQLKKGLETFMRQVRAANKYFNDRAPWALRKTNPEACGTVIANCLDACRLFMIVGAPYLPFTAAKLAKMLQVSPDMLWQDAVKPLPDFHSIGKPEILFPILDEERPPWIS